MDEPVQAIEVPVPFAPVDGQAVLCPLCTYDLRGLIEPRCPECGYRFVWTELLDEKRKTHPYLFEHYPRNNIWSFVRTVVGGLNPVRFWRTLRPQMTPRPGRLYLYWIICTILPGLLGGALLAARVVTDHFYPMPFPFFMRRARAGGIFTGNFPLRLPPQLRPAFADTIDRISELSTPYLLTTAGLIVFWTICTYLALLVFQQTMNKAQIRRIHVLRCVGYSFDLGIWCGIAGLAMVVLACFYWVEVETFIALSVLVTVALFVFAALRLWAAYRLYLVFDHAFWVVTSSQVITFLAVVTILLNVQFPIWR